MGSEASVKGFKINLKPYEYELPVIDPIGRSVMAEGKPLMRKETFDVKTAMAQMLFHGDLKLGAEDMFIAKALSDKIKAAKEFVLLDGEEMKRIKNSYNVLRGLPEFFVEFLGRIKFAEEVELEEKKLEA